MTSNPLTPKIYKDKDERMKEFELLMINVMRNIRDEKGLMVGQCWTNELVNIYRQAEGDMPQPWSI